ncbi:DegT/DnrJ/EryC1/StrS aminotransferase family protein [bacterium]|nr:DegT/DnrJ/EryC1/StrS aminotransferase family protein [bacterium]
MSRYRPYHAVANFLLLIRDFLLGRLHRGNSVHELELAIERKLGVRHCVALPMARTGIYLALKHYKLGGKRVLLSPYTISDVINMVILAGAKPEFIDVDPKTGMLSAELTEQALERYTDIGAVVITHLHGVAADIEPVLRACQQRGIPLVEDSAQALGAQLSDGRALGTLGQAGVYSLGSYKHVNAIFGGLLVTDDPAMAQSVRSELESRPFFPTSKLFSKAWFGFVYQILIWPPLFRAIVFPILRWGLLKDVEAINRAVRIELDTSRKSALPDFYLTRLTPFQARMALRQLPSLDTNSADRRALAQIYEAAFCNYASHYPAEDLGLISPEPSRRDIFTYYPAVWPDAGQYIKWAAYYGQDIVAQHLKNCAALESFREFHRDCPGSEKVAHQMLLLPTYPAYGVKNVQRNIDIFLWYCSKGKPAFSQKTLEDPQAKSEAQLRV